MMPREFSLTCIRLTPNCNKQAQFGTIHEKVREMLNHNILNVNT